MSLPDNTFRIERPSITLITVCRNNMEGLKRTVESVLGQSLPPQEMLIIDGASTDGTLAWLTSTVLPQYLTFTSESDKGIYDALNKGLRRTTSDLVMFLNSGDQLADNHALERISDSYLEEAWSWAFGTSTRLNLDTGEAFIHALRSPHWLRFITAFDSVPHQSTILSMALVRMIGDFNIDAGLCADQEHLLRAWRARSPKVLDFNVSICDTGGVSGTQPVGHYARAMGIYRKQHNIFGGRVAPWNYLLTRAGVAVDYRRKRRGVGTHAATERTTSIAQPPQ